MRRERFKIILLNTHSTLNSGDTGIVLAQVLFLKKYFADPEITLTSRTPELDRRFYHSLGIRVLPPLIPAPSVYAGYGQKARQSLKNITDWRAKKNLIDEIQKAHLVISSGGGYFYSERKLIPGPMFFQNYLPIRIAHRLRKPLIFFPQSFGPFFNPTACRILKNILASENVIKIFTREEISSDFLNSLLRAEKDREKIEICPDMAFYLKKEDDLIEGQINLVCPQPVVALTIRNWNFPGTKGIKERREKQEEYLMAMEEVCQKIYMRRGGSVVIFTQVHGPGFFEDDRSISKKLWERLRKNIPEKNIVFVPFRESLSPFSILNLLSQVDLVIATRFHSAIFALITGTPVISISYQPKGRGIMRLLGLDNFCLDISSLSSEKIIHLGQEILDHYPELQKKIREKVSSLQMMIEEKLEKALEPFFKIGKS